MNNLFKKVKTTKTNPLTWVPTVYFAMGLPFVILSMVSVLMFSDFGISNGKIAFWTSIIMLPWTLKPFWSPFLELFKTKRYFVYMTEAICGILFALIALALPLPSFFTIAIALMGVIAISGATHDVAGDGIYLTALDSQTQATYIGWQGAFYNLAKILANGALVFVAGELKELFGVELAWIVVLSFCSVVMFVIAIYHRYILPSEDENIEKRSIEQTWLALKEVVVSFFQKKNIGYYVAFIILYRFAEGFAMKIVPLFLKAPIEVGGLGLTLKQIGLVYGTFGVVAFIVGSILAGYYTAHWGLKKTLFSLCLIFNIPFVVYMFLAIYQPSSMWLIGGAIVAEYFGYGFGFVGLTLFMMQQVAEGDYKMSHYAFASGIMNLGVMIPGMLSGYMSDWLGYQNFFIWVMVATIPAMIITWNVPFNVKQVNE